MASLLASLRDKLSDMAGLQGLQSIPGIINVLQVLLGFAALFASCFIWSNTNVYIQLIYAGYGWQTLIIFILFVNWVFNIVQLVTAIGGRPILEGWPKIRKLIIYAILLVALIVSAALESWYANLSSGHGIFNPRFITVCIFNWILAISYVALIVITVLFDE